jgi:hypothetical protein
MKTRVRGELISLVLIIVSSVCFSHSGGLDSSGGHHNRSTGEYHYHTGEHSRQKTISGNPKELGFFEVILMLVRGCTAIIFSMLVGLFVFLAPFLIVCHIIEYLKKRKKP